jgi:mono/diheme cytochrome c family protein
MRNVISTSQKVLLSCAAAMLLAGCGPNLPPSKPASEFTQQEASGAAVYSKQCARCHSANTTHNIHGPGLQALYKQKYLPSGAPSSDDRVISAIRQGRGMMPGYANQLDDQQLADLIAYLHTL